MAYVTLVHSGERRPVRSIYCIGRNYVKHAAELGNAVESEPVIFLKPLSSIIHEDEAIRLPAFSHNVHHEVEIVVLLGSGGRNIPRENALACVAGYAVGLDLTARDTQDALKAKGLPWAKAKGFDTSACLSHFLDTAYVEDPAQIHFSLRVNGEIRQQGDSALMLFPIDSLISHLSTIFTLAEGDLIFTGTPEGVSRIVEGDMLEISMQNGPRAAFKVSGE